MLSRPAFISILFAGCLLVACVLFYALPASADDFHSGLYQSAMVAQEIEEYELMAKLARQAAEKGEAAAQELLGTCYTKGLGVQADWEEAKKWFGFAAAQGYAPAVHGLGLYYFMRAVQDVDSESFHNALNLFFRAVAQGHTESMAYIGYLYMKEDHPLADRAQAYKWFSLALIQGDLRGATALMKLDKVFVDDEVRQGKQLFKEWLLSHPSMFNDLIIK